MSVPLGEMRINNYIMGTHSMPSNDDIREIWRSLEHNGMQKRYLNHISKMLKKAEKSGRKIEGIKGIVDRCTELNRRYDEIIRAPHYSPIPTRNTSLADRNFKFTSKSPKTKMSAKRSVKRSKRSKRSAKK